ncbi:hypothetical protein [Leptolyngbya sp. FACHB-261]|uniref:hypothetical protein n=1 Tax=Leptolyngbya sp. FACHB-261 TaxID=2692806 RepID=UPI001685EAF7|nr:hypothetical protein [Leptolyngbya sp. FACHB-261]MBD2102283.1 hypothetical protein [Leptolyngbya sp. FACHB-261]
MRLSAAQLDLLSGVPPSALEQLDTDADPSRGLLLLLQQQELGLPVANFLVADVLLCQWFQAFQVQAFQTVGLAGQGEPLLNHKRSLKRADGIWLSASYDLLFLSERSELEAEQVEIWRLGGPVSVQSWRDRLALYLLPETSAYEPEAIRLTVWSPTHTQTHCYSRAAHQQTQVELERLLQRLQQPQPVESEVLELPTLAEIQEIPL